MDMTTVRLYTSSLPEVRAIRGPRQHKTVQVDNEMLFPGVAGWEQEIRDFEPAQGGCSGVVHSWTEAQRLEPCLAVLPASAGLQAAPSEGHGETAASLPRPHGLCLPAQGRRWVDAAGWANGSSSRHSLVLVLCADQSSPTHSFI